MQDLPQLREGQIISVFQKVIEGKRERSIPFTGRLLKVRGIGVNKTITVRQSLEKIDVEKIFPPALPTITKIEVVEQVKSLIKGQAVVHGKAKRAKKARLDSRHARLARKATKRRAKK